MGSQCPTTLSGGTVKVLVLVIMATAVMKYQVLIGSSGIEEVILFSHDSLSCRVEKASNSNK